MILIIAGSYYEPLVKWFSSPVRVMNRWWKFGRLSPPAGNMNWRWKTYHCSRFVSPTGSDGRPIFTAGLWYQPVVKIISLTVRNTDRRWWVMLQHNKIHNFFKQNRMKTNFIFVVDDFFIWNCLRSQKSVWSSYILKFIFFELYKQPQIKKWSKTKLQISLWFTTL